MEKIELFDQFTLRTIQRGEYFVAAGEILFEVAMVKSGLFRYFYIDKDGNEHTQHFVSEGEFVIAFNSFHADEPSDFYITAEEDSLILSITTDKLKNLIETNDRWKKIYYENVARSFYVKEKRTTDIIMKDSTQRYKDFKKNYPNIINRIDQEHLASFLGVKLRSLSKIRKKVAQV